MSKPLELTIYNIEHTDGLAWVDIPSLAVRPVYVDSPAFMKRFTDAELAAETHAQAAEVYRAKVHGLYPLGLIDRFTALNRFATLPHFDEVDS